MMPAINAGRTSRLQLQSMVFMCGCRSGCGVRIERQGFAGKMQVLLKHGNDQHVVIALRQTGNGNGANASGSYKENGETATVGSIVLKVKAGGNMEIGLSALML